jgi:hypothetical protein
VAKKHDLGSDYALKSGVASSNQKFLIHRDLQRIGQGVGVRGRADYRKKLPMLLVRKALGARGGGVRMDAIAAAVRCGYGDINQLFGEWIESTGLDHHLFDGCPRPLEQVRLVGQSPPEVVNEAGFTRGTYVVENGL